MIEMPYGPQVLWPTHCVQGTPRRRLPSRPRHRPRRPGAAQGLPAACRQLLGLLRERSRHADRARGLSARARASRAVWLAGLATDFCVHYSALDAVRLGFAVTLIEDACREIDLDGSHAAALAAMGEAGVALVRSGEIGSRMTDIADPGPRPRLAHRPDRPLAARHRLLQALDAADGVPPACRRRGRVQPDQPLAPRAAGASWSTRTTSGRSSTTSAASGCGAARAPGCAATPSTASAGCSGRSSWPGSRSSACRNTGWSGGATSTS